MPGYDQISKPVELIKSKQLLVEGKHALIFFESFIQNLDLMDAIQVHDFNGNTTLKQFLLQFSVSPGFGDIVKTIGVIRDAETNYKAAFQSVVDALKNAGLPTPKKVAEMLDTDPRVGVFILPGSMANGMLETLCLQSVVDDPALTCVDKYLECLKELILIPNVHDKARVQVFLASRKRVPNTLGLAARQNIWPWESPHFSKIRSFINSL